MGYTKQILVRDLRALGISEGDHVNAKVSLRAIGNVEGGAEAVLDAILEAVGRTGTVFSDAFVKAYPLPLSEANKVLVVREDTPSYAGALVNTMVKHPASFRSPHPIQKFVGIGSRAEELTKAHTSDSVAYELLGALAELGGKNLKIGDDLKVPGVGTTHVEIERLGIRRRRSQQLGVMYETGEGAVNFYEMNWAGGCAHAWLKFYQDYERIGAFLGVGRVGDAPSKLSDMRTTLDYDLRVIREDPKVLLCGRGACKICSLEWEFSHKIWPLWALCRIGNRIAKGPSSQR